MLTTLTILIASEYFLLIIWFIGEYYLQVTIAYKFILLTREDYLPVTITCQFLQVNILYKGRLLTSKYYLPLDITYHFILPTNWYHLQMNFTDNITYK